MIPENSKKFSLKQFLKKIDSTYEYSIYNKKLNNNIFSETDLPTVEPTFSEEIIKKYFNYRVKEMNSIDHGIIGGFIQFDKLIKNFKEQYDSASCFNKIVDGAFYTDHNKRTLVWRKEHLWHFAFVADAILAHNIWFVDSSNDKSAQKYQVALSPDEG